MHSLADRFHLLNDGIRNACLDAGRPADACRLLAVSKTRSAAEVRALAALGQRDVGENYVQEALEKMAQLNDLPLVWHLIGPLQSNKTREVAEHFDWVHSLDREKIARRLNDQRPPGRQPLNVCIQVNIDSEDAKSGVAPADVAALATAILAMPRLQLRGLMTIPRPGQPEGPGNAFARLATTLQELAVTIPGLAAGQAGASGAFDTLSMGMSDDFPQAIAHGATWVRIGTALFGPRHGKPA
jgi:pyridoxal phosphate enzyme (YggS family)